MQTQFEYIRDLAGQYQEYTEDSDLLFAALRDLSVEDLQTIFEEYGDPDLPFRPVNLLRAETVRLLLEGEVVDEDRIDEIKEQILQKNTNYFSSWPGGFLEELKAYPTGKRDIFANWKRPWSVCYPFLYRGKTKETVQQYLDQIGRQLLTDLNLSEYTAHTVDFAGPNNFGIPFCWLALFPQAKQSHRYAHQFFLRLSGTPQAGHMTGFALEKLEEEIQAVTSYAATLDYLQTLKAKILKLNRQLRNYFKFAPGEQAVQWEAFFEEGIAALDFTSLGVGNLNTLQNREALNLKAGLPEDSASNNTMNLWLFKNAVEGDVVFANKGTNTCIGIGLVEGKYYYEKKYPYPHRRRVNWLTNKVYHYKAGAFQKYKTLFRPDTFSPTKVGEFLLAEYVRLFPELQQVFDQHQLPYQPKKTQDMVMDVAMESLMEETDREPNFWWLNANPNIWKITHQPEGTIQTYTARNERGNKRRIYKHFAAASPGDYVIGYESSPVKRVQAILQITRGLHQREAEGEVIEFEVLEKFEVPVHWSELVNHPGLKNCDVFVNNQGSLFRLSEEEFDIIRDMIDTKNIDYEQFLQQNQVRPYKYSEDPDRPFIPAEEIAQMVQLLRRKKNIILQGPPGVGKTFVARKLAYEMMGAQNDAQIELVQFHQSYSYEDFIQGLRPARGGGFELQNGLFYNFSQRALAHPNQSFFLIIDEINRGNLSRIFGELMVLIEADKRQEQYQLRLTYAEADDALFYVPPNLYLIGTMNTADRSLAIVDYALRRRFAFVDLAPSFKDTFQQFLQEKGLSKKMVQHISRSVEKVNQQIREEVSLGSGFQIGHSYFCNYEKGIDEADWYEGILRYELQPLLEEIWFDDLEMARKLLEVLGI